MSTGARDSGSFVIVSDDDLMELLADALEMANSVEARMLRIAQQLSLQGATDSLLSEATVRAESAKIAAQKLALKAITIARDAVLLCDRLDDSRSRPKRRRVFAH